MLVTALAQHAQSLQTPPDLGTGLAVFLGQGRQCSIGHAQFETVDEVGTVEAPVCRYAGTSGFCFKAWW